jgi:hypothetical protein
MCKCRETAKVFKSNFSLIEHAISERLSIISSSLVNRLMLNLIIGLENVSHIFDKSTYLLLCLGMLYFSNFSEHRRPATYAFENLLTGAVKSAKINYLLYSSCCSAFFKVRCYAPSWYDSVHNDMECNRCVPRKTSLRDRCGTVHQGDSAALHVPA